MHARFRRLQRDLTDRSGLTLIELLMSLVVLSIGILGVAAMFPYGSASSTDDRLLTNAVELAQQRMEQIRAVSYSDPDLEPGVHPSTGWEQLGPNNRFQRRYFVQQLGAGLTDAKRVQIEVTWDDVRPDTVRLVTYVVR